MDIEKKLIELSKRKKIMEAQAQAQQGQINQLQQQMANLNKDYLLLLGEIKAYEDMIKEELKEKE